MPGWGWAQTVGAARDGKPRARWSFSAANPLSSGRTVLADAL